MGRTAGIWPYVCLVPALAAFMVLEIVPALGTSIFSFTDYTGLPHAAINWVGLQNYHDLLTGGQTFLVRALVFLPVVLGATVNGLTWYVMFNPLSGPVTLVLGELGIRAILLGTAAT